MESLKILYVEDEESIRNFNALLIKKLCPNTVTASNAADGLKLYKSFNPDVIITDIDMPGLDGLDLAKSIRRDDERTRILITTAHTDKDYLMKAVELRLTKYLEKPVSQEALEDALKQCFKELHKSIENCIEIDLGKGFEYNTKLKILTKNQESISLKKRETLLLDLLATNIEQIVEYNTIEQNVWEGREMTSNALRSIMKDLRKKLTDGAIANISGMGYKLSKID